MSHKNVQHLIPTTNSKHEVESSIGEEFVLCKNGNIVFHWADFFETCDEVMNNVDFSKKEVALSALNRVTVWIRAHNKIHKTSVYELYEKFILSKSELLGGVNPFETLEMSFISSTGPFKSLSVAECFNKDTYKEFIEVFLVRGRLPKRDYRIRLKSKILFEYGSSFSKAELVSLEQLTSKGMLFSADAEIFNKKFGKEKKIRMLIDSTVLQDAKNKDLHELKSHFAQYSFNLLYSAQREDALEVEMKDISIQSSFDFQKNPKVFIFIPYEKISSEKTTSIKSICDFVEQTKELVRSHYKERAKSA